MITRDEIEMARRWIHGMPVDSEVTRIIEGMSNLARLGLCVVESEVTTKDLGHAARVVDDVKRFDGNSDDNSERKRARTMAMLDAIAAELRGRG